jgi:large subunit ribosomal protein L20
MPRVKSGPAHLSRRNKILKLAKGFRGRRKNNYRVARTAVFHSLADAYKDRRRKKRDMRGLWIVRLGAAAKQLGIPYSKLIGKMAAAHVLVNRKILANIAIREPAVFRKIVETVNK